MTGNAWLQDILALELDARTKGIPLATERVRLGDVGKQGWNLLRGDLMFPVLALRDVRMRQNLRVLRDFARHHQVDLAPHGKSTMSPQLYQDQLEVGGAWGITAATVQQCAVVAASGVPNVIVANEIVGRANVAQLAGLKRAYPRTAIYSLVDSGEVVEQLVRHGGPALAPGTRFQVLLELGYAGGRTGARTMERALAVLDAVRAHPDVLELAGIECYEGTINLEGADETIQAVDRFLEFVLEVLGRARQLDAFKGRGETLLTAGGSSYFDRVAAKFTPARRGPGTRVVLRGGSYLTYDHGFYRRKMGELRDRGGIATAAGVLDPTVALQPALELWALVQALHEPGSAIMTMGIRDLPYDLGYPFPLRQYRDGKPLAEVADTGYAIVNSNDQHCYLRYSAGADIRIGDLFAFGISHPCTAFDKWDVLYRVDEELNVIGAVKTFF
jgi:D-serine deaminase-like pyridoxal phosphate-dependent protein